MNTAASEWAERVKARNAIETAKARGDAALAAQGFLPLTYGEQPAPLSAGAVRTASVQQQGRCA